MAPPIIAAVIMAVVAAASTAYSVSASNANAARAQKEQDRINQANLIAASQAKQADITAHEMNAQASLTEARTAREAAGLQGELKQLELEKALSSERAIVGTSGLVLEGSPLFGLMSQAEELSKQVQLSTFNTRQQASQLEYQGQLESWKAKIASERELIPGASYMNYTNPVEAGLFAGVAAGGKAAGDYYIGKQSSTDKGTAVT